jgi:CRISPR-associated endonuclease/helicase Cas3
MPAPGIEGYALVTDLRPAEFDDFFEAVHGFGPFPWQKRLAEKVFATKWPDALDIPTGAGKTAAIDIAVFHMALEAMRRSDRQAPLRILFVVDRRLIVDNAYDRAQTIAKRLWEAKEGVLKRVADRLRHLGEDGGKPLAVVRLRGGMPKEPDWVRTPAQPTVVVSTVDQVGSRLLFRGYGVSDTMKPIHAGLLGADALLLLDEAHLSQPFVQTVRDAMMFRREPWTENRAPAPFGVVTLSATQVIEQASGSAGEGPFTISDDDHKDSRLAKRLDASKPAELIAVPSGEADFVNQFAGKAWELADCMRNGAVVAIVVNRVWRARAIFNALQKKGALPFPEPEAAQGGVSAPEVALLTGRVRDLDRDWLLDGLLPFVQAGPLRRDRDRSLIVVATQCVEAGADLDFDALVTEIAPLDCLRQRFGRLNRMGREIDAYGTIVATFDQVKKSAEDDPIYGAAPRHTWNLLVEKSFLPGKKKASNRVVDFGIRGSEAWFPAGDALERCLAPKKDAPVLLPSTVDFWSRTSPIPAADPDVSLYLHGSKIATGDVDIVWRADIDDEIDEDDLRQELWIERVGVCPPASPEAISIPLVEARRWLRGEAFGDIADTEVGDEETPRRSAARRPNALRWKGADNDQTKLARPDEVRPGDVIVVPASRGGCDRWGWDPNSKAGARDWGREASRRQRGRDILRLTDASPELSQSEIASTAAMIDLSDEEIPREFAKHLQDEAAFGRPRIVRSKDGRPLAIERRLRPARRGEQDSGGDAVTEDDESVRSIRQRPVLLSQHSRGVEEYARLFAEQAGLPFDLVEDAALAGYLHDAGKAQPDFKRFLYGGDELAAIGGADLAKSAKLPGSPQAWQEVRPLADLPKGARHEVASLRFADAHPRFATARDPYLVLWLIGTHHGYGRPFFPAPERECPVRVRLSKRISGTEGSRRKPHIRRPS